MKVLRVEIVGGEGLIYLATRVSRKVGGPEDIAEELKDERRVRRLLTNIVKAGHLSVLEHTLVRVWADSSWSEITNLFFHHKYVEASREDNGILLSMNIRTVVEGLEDLRLKPFFRDLLVNFPIIAGALGIGSDKRPILDVNIEKVSDDPLVYSFVKSPYRDPRHGFFAFWSEMSRVASHQFVRHRRLSFTQRSGRYTKPDGYILPNLDGEIRKFMEEHASLSHEIYNKLLNMGVRREDARYILPAALKTALFVSGRQSDWLHFLKLRTDAHAQDEIRRFALVVASVVEK